MKIKTCVGVVEPSLSLLHPKPYIIFSPTLRIPSTHEKRIALHSTTRSSVSATSSVSKPKTPRSGQKQKQGSLYSRPSLLHMKSERIETRARVNEFLKGIGIASDELDGLELPVTVEVMRERVEFLHNIGLTIDDINYYPLVLGCSVKKNMIPVLDYLGKLGVRKSTVTELLRRYPQVLHASVVVDLAPVVRYLVGMDVKPDDIHRVLEKYPEVLGFKIEGTMSTSVAYLVGIGVTRREIGGIITRYPEILGFRVGRVIKPFVDYLETLGIPRFAIAALIEKQPHILGFGLEETVKPNVETLLGFNVRDTSLSSIVAQYPAIIGLDLKEKLTSRRDSLNEIIDLSPEEFGRVIERMPQVASLNNVPMMKHVDFFASLGFSKEQIKEMVVECPQVLALSLEIMKLSFDYFQTEMDRTIDDLVAFPAFFTYGLESTIKPRHMMVLRKGFTCSLAWLLNCSDEKFRQRMDYDSIDMDEMEAEEPLFDMNTLRGPESNESDSDYEDYIDDELV